MHGGNLGQNDAIEAAPVPGVVGTPCSFEAGSEPELQAWISAHVGRYLTGERLEALTTTLTKNDVTCLPLLLALQELDVTTMVASLGQRRALLTAIADQKKEMDMKASAAPLSAHINEAPAPNLPYLRNLNDCHQTGFGSGGISNACSQTTTAPLRWLYTDAFLQGSAYCQPQLHPPINEEPAPNLQYLHNLNDCHQTGFGSGGIGNACSQTYIDVVLQRSASCQPQLHQPSCGQPIMMESPTWGAPSHSYPIPAQGLWTKDFPKRMERKAENILRNSKVTSKRKSHAISGGTITGYEGPDKGPEAGSPVIISTPPHCASSDILIGKYAQQMRSCIDPCIRPWFAVANLDALAQVDHPQQKLDAIRTFQAEISSLGKQHDVKYPRFLREHQISGETGDCCFLLMDWALGDQPQCPQLPGVVLRERSPTGFRQWIIDLVVKHPGALVGTETVKNIFEASHGLVCKPDCWPAFEKAFVEGVASGYSGQRILGTSGDMLLFNFFLAGRPSIGYTRTPDGRDGHSILVPSTCIHGGGAGSVPYFFLHGSRSSNKTLPSRWILHGDMIIEDPSSQGEHFNGLSEPTDRISTQDYIADYGSIEEHIHINERHLYVVNTLPVERPGIAENQGFAPAGVPKLKKPRVSVPYLQKMFNMIRTTTDGLAASLEGFYGTLSPSSLCSVLSAGCGVKDNEFIDLGSGIGIPVFAALLLGARTGCGYELPANTNLKQLCESSWTSISEKPWGKRLQSPPIFHWQDIETLANLHGHPQFVFTFCTGMRPRTIDAVLALVAQSDSCKTFACAQPNQTQLDFVLQKLNTRDMQHEWVCDQIIPVKMAGTGEQKTFWIFTRRSTDSGAGMDLDTQIVDSSMSDSAQFGPTALGEALHQGLVTGPYIDPVARAPSSVCFQCGLGQVDDTTLLGCTGLGVDCISGIRCHARCISVAMKMPRSRQCAQFACVMCSLRAARNVSKELHNGPKTSSTTLSKGLKDKKCWSCFHDVDNAGRLRICSACNRCWCSACAITCKFNSIPCEKWRCVLCVGCENYDAEIFSKLAQWISTISVESPDDEKDDFVQAVVDLKGVWCQRYKYAVPIVLDLCTRISPSQYLALDGSNKSIAFQLAEQFKIRTNVALVSNQQDLNFDLEECLKIGFLSNCFLDHPTLDLIYSVISAMTRMEKVNVFAFSTRKDPHSGMQGKLKALCGTKFVDLSRLGAEGCAAEISSAGIHCLIFLDAHHDGGRWDILAQNPARVQMTLLGYPGSTASSMVHYNVADQNVIPAADRKFYAEQLLFVNCYQPNSYKELYGDVMRTVRDRSTEARQLLRMQHGLPRDGCVFCNFSRLSRISEETLKIWIQILNSGPNDSFLWLYSDSMASEIRIRAFLETMVSPGRVGFGHYMPKPAHLDRISLADIYLDQTDGYKGHTTLSDATAVGVCFISLVCETDAWQGRVSAALHHALDGKGSVIVNSTHDYISNALRLASMDTRATLASELLKALDSSSFLDADLYAHSLVLGVREACLRKGTGGDIVISELPGPARLSGLPVLPHVAERSFNQFQTFGPGGTVIAGSPSQIGVHTIRQGDKVAVGPTSKDWGWRLGMVEKVESSTCLEVRFGADTERFSSQCSYCTVYDGEDVPFYLKLLEDIAQEQSTLAATHCSFAMTGRPKLPAEIHTLLTKNNIQAKTLQEFCRDILKPISWGDSCTASLTSLVEKVTDYLSTLSIVAASGSQKSAEFQSTADAIIRFIKDRRVVPSLEGHTGKEGQIGAVIVEAQQSVCHSNQARNVLSPNVALCQHSQDRPGLVCTAGITNDDEVSTGIAQFMDVVWGNKRDKVIKQMLTGTEAQKQFYISMADIEQVAAACCMLKMTNFTWVSRGGFALVMGADLKGKRVIVKININVYPTRSCNPLYREANAFLKLAASRGLQVVPSYDFPNSLYEVSVGPGTNDPRPRTVTMFVMDRVDTDSVDYVQTLRDQNDGSTLPDRILPPPTEEMRYFMRSVLVLLDETNSHGVVQLDLTFANILFASPNKEFQGNPDKHWHKAEYLPGLNHGAEVEGGAEVNGKFLQMLLCDFGSCMAKGLAYSRKQTQTREAETVPTKSSRGAQVFSRSVAPGRAGTCGGSHVNGSGNPATRTMGQIGNARPIVVNIERVKKHVTNSAAKGTCGFRDSATLKIASSFEEALPAQIFSVGCLLASLLKSKKQKGSETPPASNNREIYQWLVGKDVVDDNEWVSVANEHMWDRTFSFLKSTLHTDVASRSTVAELLKSSFILEPMYRNELKQRLLAGIEVPEQNVYAPNGDLIGLLKACILKLSENKQGTGLSLALYIGKGGAKKGDLLALYGGLLTRNNKRYSRHRLSLEFKGLYIDSEQSSLWPLERFLQKIYLGGFINSSRDFSGTSNPHCNCSNPAAKLYFDNKEDPTFCIGAMFAKKDLVEGEEILWDYPWEL